MKAYNIKIIIFLWALFSLLLYKEAKAEEKKSNLKEPITITSKTLTADNKAKTAIFEGSVKATKGDITLLANKMIVYYQEGKTTNSIKQIDAEGNVKLIKGNRVVISDYAQYFPENEERVIFTGNPKATDGENIVIGSKMIFFFKSNKYIVENSKVFLQDTVEKRFITPKE
ncbi:MAG: hypothetical protein N3A59_05080 [Thermodesulfovibrionales bacterium]|nr:hypothetical protein [Thermodesulfovibrionales bacterium]